MCYSYTVSQIWFHVSIITQYINFFLFFLTVNKSGCCLCNTCPAVLLSDRSLSLPVDEYRRAQKNATLTARERGQVWGKRLICSSSWQRNVPVQRYSEDDEHQPRNQDQLLESAPFWRPKVSQSALHLHLGSLIFILWPMNASVESHILSNWQCGLCEVSPAHTKFQFIVISASIHPSTAVNLCTRTQSERTQAQLSDL